MRWTPRPARASTSNTSDGRSCTASFLLCPACPNAVATPAHLPRLIGLHRALTELAAAVSVTVWASDYAVHFARLEQLLSARHTRRTVGGGRVGHTAGPQPRGRAATAKPGHVSRPAELTPIVISAPEDRVLADRVGAVTDGPAFGDDQWDLRPLSRKASSGTLVVSFDLAPPRFRSAARHLCWSWLHHETPVGDLQRTTATRQRVTAATVVGLFQDLLQFLRWLEPRQAEQLADLTADVLDEFAAVVNASPTSRARKSRLLFSITRIWLHNPYLPPEHRLQRPPWEDPGARTFLGASDWTAENKTPPQHPQVVSPLLTWSLRFVEQLAPDILAAIHERDRLRSRIRPHPRREDRAVPAAYAEHQRATGAGLPGRSGKAHGLGLAHEYLAGTLGIGDDHNARKLLPADLPLVHGAPLAIDITGRWDDRTPWLEMIDYYQVPVLRSLLATACLTVIAYLSGIRSDEVRELRRGCCTARPTAATGRHDSRSPGWGSSPPWTRTATASLAGGCAVDPGSSSHRSPARSPSPSSFRAVI